MFKELRRMDKQSKKIEGAKKQVENIKNNQIDLKNTINEKFKKTLEGMQLPTGRALSDPGAHTVR